MASRIQRELAFLLTGKDVSASRAMRGVRGEITGLERHTGKAFRNISRNMERGIILGAGATAGAIGYAATKAIEWESAFAGVRKTVEGTPEQLAAIEQGLRDMAKVMPVSATDLAAIAENAGALGIKRDDILEFTRTVAMLGATTDVSTDMASTALGQLQNVLGLTGSEFGAFAAALVDLGNKGASTESQILEIARRSGGAAALIGVAKDETLGWASAAANLGMNEELAGTSLQSFFAKTLSATSTGGDKLKALAKTAGLTGAGFKKAFGTDATGTLSRFLRGLGKLPKAQRLSVVQQVFGKGTGLTRLILGLADSFDRNLNPALEGSREAWKEGTAAQEEYEKRAATTASQLQILRNNIDDAAVTIGSALLPQINELAKEGVDWIQNHQPEIKAFADDLAKGLRDAVEWARKLDWGKITSSLQAGAGAAKTIAEAILSLDPTVLEALAAVFVANKVTGGVIGDIAGGAAGALGKGLILKSMGVQAGVVNVNGPVSGFGGAGAPGGAGGAAGALAPMGIAALGATAAAGSVLGVLAASLTRAVGDGLVGAGLLTNDQLDQTMRQAFGPFEYLRDIPGYIGQTQDAFGQLTTFLNAPHPDFLGDLGNLLMLDYRPDKPPSGTPRNPGEIMADNTAKLQAIKDEQTRSLVAFREAERTMGTVKTSTDGVERATADGLRVASSTDRSGHMATTSAVNAAAARIAGAVAAARTVVNVNQSVGPTSFNTQNANQNRAGKQGGSRAGANNPHANTPE